MHSNMENQKMLSKKNKKSLQFKDTEVIDYHDDNSSHQSDSDSDDKLPHVNTPLYKLLEQQNVKKKLAVNIPSEEATSKLRIRKIPDKRIG